MQNKLYIFAFATLLLLVGCDDKLKEDAKLDISIISEGSLYEGDVLVVYDSTDVVFNFSGNPDFITFYSGEAGHEYSKRHLTESPIDEVNSHLEFKTKNQYGNAATVQGTLRVYLSTTFEGMYKNNKKADSLNVENNSWINVTTECEIPNTPNTTSNRINLPLDTYLGQKLTIAFQYYTTNNTAAQPVWEILDLKIVNTNKTTGLRSELKATSLGFTPLDMYAVGNAAYNTVNNNTEGVWNLSNISNASDPKMRIHSSGAGKPLNHDWLISNPVIVNARTPDSGVGIKTITNYLDSYTHVYNKPGTYTVTIIARNANFESSSEVIKEYTIKVVEKKK